MSNAAYIYTRSAGEADAPLLFVFHGTGGDEHQLVALGRKLLPEAEVVSPRGDVSEGGAARFFRRTGEGVYDMADLARATEKMVEFVTAVSRAEPDRRVLGLGYSNGANILASTLFASPLLFDAAVLMHPLIPFEPRVNGSLAGKQVLITAGLRDPICPPKLTQQLEASLNANGARVTTDWHEGGHEMRHNEIEAARTFLQRATQEAVF